MVINIIIDPICKNSPWCNETLSGIDSKVLSLRYESKIITEDKITSELECLIVIASSPSWLEKIVAACKKHSVKPIVTSNQPIILSEPCGYVLIDHNDAMVKCMDYLSYCKKDRVALYGVRKSSFADSLKCNYFKKEDIFYLNDASYDGLFENFWQKHEKYNSVLCVDATSSIHLIMELKKRNVEIPKDLFLVSCADSSIGKIFSPSITAVAFDNKMLGVHTVLLYRYLYKCSDAVTMTVSLPCKIIYAESTNFIKPGKSKKRKPIYNIKDFDFAKENGSISQKIQSLDLLFHSTDKLDLDILGYMATGTPYGAIAKALFISESTVKYRIKQLLNSSGFESASKMAKAYFEIFKT